MYYFHLNRTLCDVLDEMRKCDKTKNYGYLLSLIEEAQSMGNRMEAGLGEKKDVVRMKEDIAELKTEIKKLQKKKQKLESKVNELELDD